MGMEFVVVVRRSSTCALSCFICHCRQPKTKAKDQMTLEGAVDLDTENRLSYQEHKVSRQHNMKRQDKLKPLEGVVGKETESNVTYREHPIQKQQPLRPSHANGINLEAGIMDAETETNLNYREKPYSKQGKAKVRVLCYE